MISDYYGERTEGSSRGGQSITSLRGWINLSRQSLLVDLTVPGG
jgi:hypothetical protein